MKLLMLIGSILIIQLTNSQNDQLLTTLKTQVSGRVWLSESYCKGTESDEHLQNHLLPNQKFYLYEGGILNTHKTLNQIFYSDDMGQFSIYLDQGIYTISTEPILNNNLLSDNYFISNIIWVEGPLYEFYANESNLEIILSFYIPCPPGPERM
jgi:hypothetical protein